MTTMAAIICRSVFMVFLLEILVLRRNYSVRRDSGIRYGPYTVPFHMASTSALMSWPLAQFLAPVMAHLVAFGRLGLPFGAVGLVVMSVVSMGAFLID
jgi:hypothetical protein